MGTRSLTFVYDQLKDREYKIINMYRQYDGYPSGHGVELAEFLSEAQKTGYNGVNDLAALLVANFKDGPYSIYLYPTEIKDCGQDYEYHIFNIDGELHIEVYNCGVNFFGLTQSEQHDKIFEGNLLEFAEFCSAEATA